MKSNFADLMRPLSRNDLKTIKGGGNAAAKAQCGFGCNPTHNPYCNFPCKCVATSSFFYHCLQR